MSRDLNSDVLILSETLTLLSIIVQPVCMGKMNDSTGSKKEEVYEVLLPSLFK